MAETNTKVDISIELSGYNKVISQIAEASKKIKELSALQNKLGQGVDCDKNTKELEGYIKKLGDARKDLDKLLKAEQKAQISQTKESFKTSRQNVDADPELSEGDKKMARIMLAAEEEKQIATIRGMATETLVKQITKIEKGNAQEAAAEITTIKKTAIDQQHADEVAAATGNARELKDIEITKMQELIAEKKQLGLDTTQEEISLRKLNYEAYEINANAELAAERNNAEATLKTTREKLDKQLEMHQANAQDRKTLLAQQLADGLITQEEYNQKELLINQDLADKEDAIAKQKGKSITDYLTQLMTTLTSMKSNLDTTWQKFEDRDKTIRANSKKEEQEEAKKKYKEDLAKAEGETDAAQQKIDLEKNYKAKQQEIEDKYAKKQAEADRKIAARKKAMALFDITMNTAQAVMKIWSTQGLAAIVTQAFAIAAGAVQFAAVAATPLPKAERGGMIGGHLHASGGTLIEAEAGEAIINRRSVSMFAPLLSAINEAGGGVPFARPYSDGGFASREYARQSGATIDYSTMADAVGSVLEKQKIYVAVTDIADAEKRYLNLKDEKA